MAGAGKLEIDVQVRLDKLETQLVKVEQAVMQTGKKVEKTAGRFDSMAKGISKATLLAGKLVVAVTAIAGVVKIAEAGTQLFKAAFRALSGDAAGAEKAIAAFGETIRSLPVVGGIIGGIADAFVSLLEEISGVREELERLEKELVKVTAQAALASQALDIKRQNNDLKLQIEMLKSKSDFHKADIALAIQMNGLEQKRRKMLTDITNEHTKGSRAHQVASDQINEQIDLQKEILQIQHDQNDERMTAQKTEAKRAEELAAAKQKLREEAQALKQIENAEGTIASLEDQLRIATALTDADKRRATMMAQQNQIMREFAEQQKRINEDETLSNQQREKLLGLLNQEKNLKIDLVRLADDAAREAEREAEAQKIKEEALRKQGEHLREQKRLLEVQQGLDSKRAGELERRLGLASATNAPTKSGFTETASTAMGSFTFGEQGAQDKIKELQKEQLDLQKTMEQRLQNIEKFAQQMAQGGF